MATENVVLMKQARETLSDKWGLAVGITTIYMVITIVVGSPKDIGPVLQAIIEGPLQFGLAIFSLSLVRGKGVSISQLFEGFNDFIRILVAYLLMGLFVLLWALLLIVPGIIAALAYSQTFFILVDDKSISARDALRKSKSMMYGHKKKLFYLGLRFFGWFLLGVLSLGIGFLWILPYFYVTMAKFYEEVSVKAPK
ncbi:MAG: DUF975 family protein [Candidatus Paceibacterota bacterium]|jgi:uncharacterized membrane protein